MLYDTHVHTDVSADSEMELTEALSAANQLQLRLIVTEHVDYICDSEIDFVADVPQYLEKYAPYKAEGLLTGLEIGLTAVSLDRNRVVTSDPRLDYIIGSVHVVGEHDIYTTFFKQTLPQEAIYRQYLQYSAEMIELYDCFDSLGHIDYPSRYSPFTEKEIDYHQYQPEYDRIFALLCGKGKALEINTRRFGDPPGKKSVKNGKKNILEICRGYYRCGGRFVTIGSDAHRPEDIGRHLGEAYEMAWSVGLMPVYFQNRQMHNIEPHG